MPRNGERFMSWRAFWGGGAVVVTILVAIAAAHTARPHAGAVSGEILTEHVTAAREERRDISSKIDHLEASIHSVETEQAVMSDTLDRIYGEIQGMSE